MPDPAPLHLGQRRHVPMSEYDALIEILRVIVDEATMHAPEDAIEVVDREIGSDAATFARRILVGNERARELFGDRRG